MHAPGTLPDIFLLVPEETLNITESRPQSDLPHLTDAGDSVAFELFVALWNIRAKSDL